MVFPIAGGTQDTGYEISNSLRFNDDDSPKVSRSISSSGSARNATLSVWVKRGNLGTRQQIYSNKTADSGFSGMNMYFNASNDRLYIDHHDGSNNKSLYTTQVFRDVSAWYHIVHAIDTTTGTATNRLRLYINGTEVTDFATDQNPSQNADLELSNSTGDQSIGDDPRDSNDFFDGYMAEYNFVDGTTLDPTYFGEFNDNGVWIPKKPDTSGNDNHMSVTNLAATDVTTDTPTNNFCTLNPLDNYYASSTFSEGNVKMVSASTGSGTSTNAFKTSTFGLTNGKWYWEAKLSNETGYDQIGISQLVASSTSDHLGNSSSAYSIRGDTGNFMNNNSAVSYGVSFTTNDIISVALDLDNNLIYFYKNGTIMNSGTGKSISAGTYFPSFGKQDPAAVTWEVNFGNPSFSISSGNSDGAGYGNFEYAVPSGYYSCCTKNLAEYG